MNDKPDDVAQQPERLSLSRWSRRKLEAARAADTAARRYAGAGRRGSAAAAGAYGWRRASQNPPPSRCRRSSR